MTRILLFNKPYLVLCQFTDPDGRPNLADFIPVKGVYAAGRLDYDSEGLVVLTDSGSLQHSITDPQSKVDKVYWVQVEGIPEVGRLQELEKGVRLKDGLTAPAKLHVIPEPALWTRTPPIRFRKE